MGLGARCMNMRSSSKLRRTGRIGTRVVGPRWDPAITRFSPDAASDAVTSLDSHLGGSCTGTLCAGGGGGGGGGRGCSCLKNCWSGTGTVEGGCIAATFRLEAKQSALEGIGRQRSHNLTWTATRSQKCPAPS